MNYRLLILGVIGKSGLKAEATGTCFERITANVFDEFCKLGHVETYALDVYSGFLPRNPHDHPPVPHHGVDDMRPNTDFVLYIDWDNSPYICFDEIKKRTGAKKIVSLLEVDVSNVDWSFSFVHRNAKNSTRIVAPCSKKLLKNVPKRKVIVTDHWIGSLTNAMWCGDQSGDKDWTARILEWLSEVKDTYEIRRMTRFETDTELGNLPELVAVPLRPHEVTIPHMQYGEFLQRTEDAETFVVTHAEGYGYGVIDMLARGIRVVSPPNFLSPDLVEPFQIPVFHNKQEFLSLVTAPLEPRWNDSVNKCTDWSEVVKVVDEKFRSYLR